MAEVIKRYTIDLPQGIRITRHAADANAGQAKAAPKIAAKVDDEPLRWFRDCPSSEFLRHRAG